MVRYGLAIALAASLLAGLAADASAASRVKGNNIGLSGCTQFRVPFCTIMSSGGTTYWLTDATPPIPAGVGVTLVGEKGGTVNPCFATAVKVLKWKRNRLRCPLN